MRKSLCVIALLSAFHANAATTHNDDSCDIALLPAATLLLPYFEVDFNAQQQHALTTLFTIFNTSRSPQIARVTLWSDWAYPVMSFSVFLTGYDVQAINLYDVLGRGTIAGQGTSDLTAPGSRSLDNDANPHFLAGAANACINLPGLIPGSLRADVQRALTTGIWSACGTTKIGGAHANAVGYATIDLVATCGSTLPTDPLYYNELLYDNVLGGDWQLINPSPVTGNYAGGSPLVPIRAIPEGGPAGVVEPTNLPYTFYDRYTPHFDRNTPAMDRRQPLPSAFVARDIQGGIGAFNTNLVIWREGLTGAGATCRTYIDNAEFTRKLHVAEVVRFDEHENPTTKVGGPIVLGYDPNTYLKASSRISTSDGAFPTMSNSGDVAGWIYLNLTNPGSSVYTSKVPAVPVPNYSGIRPTQNWVVVDMSAEGRFETLSDATALGNGCTPTAPFTVTHEVEIGPGPNATP